MLHLAVGNKESEGCWVEFFRHMVARGLRIPTSATSDGSSGLINAIKDAPTLNAAWAQADRVTNRDRGGLPAAVACFEDDLEALLAIHRIPVRHRINVRTTNLVSDAAS